MPREFALMSDDNERMTGYLTVSCFQGVVMSEAKRGLSDEFMQDLLAGFLNPLLVRVKEDDSLALFIRNEYINIYYRGGNLLKLERKDRENFYRVYFDPNYAQGGRLPAIPEKLADPGQVADLIGVFPVLKQFIDRHRTAHPALEREFQQLVARENNYSRISNETEYFVIDMEASYPEVGGKFDIVACKWTAAARREDHVQLVLMEIKYGDFALEGQSGLLKHLADARNLLDDPANRELLRMTAQVQLNQLNGLGLLRHAKTARKFSVHADKPELVLLLANHNPRSSILPRILDSAELKAFSDARTNPFELRFFTASAAGYAMHESCMLSPERFRQMHFLKN